MRDRKRFHLNWKGTLLFLLCIPCLLLLNVKADSGWDSSYDSGSSWSSSSDSSWSSSSWSDDYGTTYTTKYGSSIDVWEILIIFLTIIIIVIVLSSLQKNGNLKNTVEKIDSSLYQEILEDKLKALLPNSTLQSLKNELFERFIAIQNAWMEFDYDALREYCTDELFNSYISQLDVLKLKNGKNIMKDFKLLDAKIINIQEEESTVAITTYMTISFYDYVIDTTNNKVTRGTEHAKITNRYVMTFIKSREEHSIDYCPNCGAPVTNHASNKCEYCDSVIVKGSNTFVLSKKTNVNK